MIRHLFKKHKRERYGVFTICVRCGVLEYFKDGRYSYNFRGTNLTYDMLKELQLNSLVRIK